MLRKRRTKHCSLRTALLAVILLLMGVALIVGSLWLQEGEISASAYEYSAMANELKIPIETGNTVDEVLTVRYDPDVDQQLATLFPSTTVCPEMHVQVILRPASLALPNAGKSIPARIAIIAITTNNSIRVNDFFFINFSLFFMRGKVLFSVLPILPFQNGYPVPNSCLRSIHSMR